MRKTVLIIFGIVVLLAAGGSAAYQVATSSEEVPQNKDVPAQTVQSGEKLRQGSFIELDRIHKGTGKATVYQTGEGPVLKFEENFTVTEGPDLYVYLSKNANIEQDKQSGEFVSLGKLKASKGDQTYSLPADHAEFKSVSVYCRAFDTPFSVTALK